MKSIGKLTALAIIAFVSTLLTGQFAAAEVSKEELKSVSTPDKVTTSIGDLKDLEICFSSSRYLNPNSGRDAGIL